MTTTNKVTEIEVQPSQQIDFAKLLPQFAEIWPSMGETFLETLGREVVAVTLESRNDLYATARRIEDAHYADQDTVDGGQIFVEPEYHHIGRVRSHSSLQRMSLTIWVEACVGRSLWMKVSEEYLRSDDDSGEKGVAISWGFEFPTASSLSAHHVQQILNAAGVAYEVHYEETPLWEREVKTNKTIRRLIDIANESKRLDVDGEGPDYTLANQIFAALYLDELQANWRVDLSLRLERGQPAPGREDGYFDLLVLSHSQGEELRMPAPLCDPILRAEATDGGERTPDLEPDQQELEPDDGWYEALYIEACALIGRLYINRAEKAVLRHS